MFPLFGQATNMRWLLMAAPMLSPWRTADQPPFEDSEPCWMTFSDGSITIQREGETLTSIPIYSYLFTVAASGGKAIPNPYPPIDTVLNSPSPSTVPLFMYVVQNVMPVLGSV
jgi:hypothetical protein